jgi:hypothetical protein
VATLLDVRRLEAYDADKAVDKLLRDKQTRDWLGATAPEVRAWPHVCLLGRWAA